MSDRVTSGFKGSDVSTSCESGMTIVQSYGKETPGQGAAEGREEKMSLRGGIHNVSASLEGATAATVPTVGRPHRGTAQ